MRTAFKRDYASQPGSAAVLRRIASQFAERCGLDPKVVDDIRVAVGEAGNNAIEHSRSSRIVLRCEYQINKLIISLEDYGHGFKSPRPATVVCYPQPRGYGIRIMRELMDRVDYIHKPGDGTIVRLEKTVKAS